MFTHTRTHTRATSTPSLKSLYHVSLSFLLVILSQAATSSLHAAEVLHPVVLGEQINEQDGRLNPTLVLNLCLYCGWSPISYVFRLSCCHLQGVSVHGCKCYYLYVHVRTEILLCSWAYCNEPSELQLLQKGFPSRTAPIHLTSVGVSREDPCVFAPATDFSTHCNLYGKSQKCHVHSVMSNNTCSAGTDIYIFVTRLTSKMHAL